MHNKRQQQYVKRRPVSDDVLEEVPEVVGGLVPATELSHGARDATPLSA